MNKDKKSLNLEFNDVFPDAGIDCGRSEELMMYFEGLLPEQSRDEFLSHVSDCLTCGKELAGLHETRNTSLTIVDAGKADEIYHEGHAEVQKQLNKKYGVSSSKRPQGSTVPRFFQIFQLPAYANLLLIALLGALLYPTYRGLMLDNEVTRLQNEIQIEKARNTSDRKKSEPLTTRSLEPELSQSAIYGIRAERGKQNFITVDFSKQKALNILFSIPPSDLKNYSVEILQANQLIWQDSILPIPEKDASYLISIRLQSEYFQHEMYRVRIYGMNGEVKTALAEYKLQVLK